MRAVSTLRNADERSANIVTEFLEYYFYDVATTDYECVKDKERQCEGIDSIFLMNGYEYLCDEKAAIRYVNKGLKTFSFELSFIDRGGNVRDGWLLSNDMSNNSYLLVWIDKARKDLLEDVTDIDCLTMALIRKERIVEYLKDKGYDKERLARKMEYLRSNPYESKGNIKNGLKFSFSEQLVEQPINVIIPRDELIRMADFSDVIELE